MKEIVDWLIEIEELAGNLYDGAAKQFADDQTLSAFLSHMAEDEHSHYHIMVSAAEYLRKEQDIKSEISVDSTIKDRVEAPLTKHYEMLALGALTKESLIDCLIETEFSEWNHVFIYVVNTLKLRSREFMHFAAKMQHHIEELTKFLSSLPESDKYIKRISGLPEVWKISFLIVEDFEPIRTVLASLFKGEAKVETASNGKEALQKVAGAYYDVIISEMEMPVMNGMDFCKEAMKTDPDVVKRIIFCSGSNRDEFMKFIDDNDILFLRKPINIKDVRSYVSKILSSSQ